MICVEVYIMAISEAKKASDRRHMGKLAQLNIKPYKDEAEQIKQAAADAGQSTQGYILDAVRQRMQGSASDDGQRVHISIGYGTIDAVRLDGESREQAARRILSDALRGK